MDSNDFLRGIKDYSFIKHGNELKIDYIIGGDISYNFNFLRIFFNFIIYIVIFIAGLISCCLGYVYGAEKLHSDGLGIFFIVLSISLQIFLFIAFYNYNKNLRKGTLSITPNGINVNFKYFDKKITIPKNIIDKYVFRNDLMQLIISLKQDLFLEIDGNKKFGFIRTGIFLEKKQALILKDEINNILNSSETISEIENKNTNEDSFTNDLNLPSEYTYRETPDGFVFEGEIPSGNFGTNPIGNLFFIVSFIFFAIFIISVFLQVHTSLKIFDNESVVLVVFPLLFFVFLFIAIYFSLDSVNPSNKLRKMSIDFEGIIVDFKPLKNGKQKEAIKISKNDISQVDVVKVRHESRRYSYNTYDLYLIGKNKIFIEKDRYLPKVFIGLSLKSEFTAIKIKEKFKSVWHIV